MRAVTPVVKARVAAAVGTTLQRVNRFLASFEQSAAVHKWLHEGNDPPFSLKDSIIYHCGPVMIQRDGKWVATAAGPAKPAPLGTTSRMAPGALLSAT